jgi:hypothetical protein
MGWTDLQEGRWQAARAVFAEAGAGEPTPQAFEGLSSAAWWLDDPTAVFEAREHAYRLYKNADVAPATKGEAAQHIRINYCTTIPLWDGRLAQSDQTHDSRT